VKKDFDLARKIMVDNQIRPVGVTNFALLASLGQVAREFFVPKNRTALAYSDVDHKLSDNSYLMAPASFARLAQLADVKSSDIVLVVGCGTAYSVAVLANICNAVVGIESDKNLVEMAEEALSSLNIGNGVVLQKDTTQGVPSEAPFDVILVEGEVEEIPQALFKQLRDGGKLVAVLNDGGYGSASVFVKSGKDISKRVEFELKTPALSSLGKAQEFAL